MRFAFTEQQEEFRDAVRQLLAKECTPADVRAAFSAPSARTPRWASLAGLGVVGLPVPEELGGLGLGMVDLVPLLEESGRAALPEPLLETTALTAPLLTELAGPSPAHRPEVAGWLSSLASGDLAAAVALAGDGSGTGIVAGADGADLFVLVVPDRGGAAVHVAEADRVRTTPVASLDPTRRLATVEWTPNSATLLAAGPDAAACAVRTAHRAAVATAAQLLGLADRMIGMTAEYALARHQFGRSIGSFQAVKHLLAEARVALEFARPVVYAAAWSLDEDMPEVARSASAAKAIASDAATRAGGAALQIHGAIGYTWECDLQLFLKRTWALAETWGSATDHRLAVLGTLVNAPRR
jgi:alkylation response protein AidB-like acyl-CoA dehydrogenase